MSKYNYEYEPSSIDDEEFMTDVPLSLVLRSIQSQFEDPLFENRKRDYVQTLITKYDFIKDDKDEEDDEAEYRRETNEEEQAEFVKKMLEYFDTFLGIAFEDMEIVSPEDQNELIHMVYLFFIKNVKKNLTWVVMNYIDSHYDEIASTYPKKKDVTTLSFRNADVSDGDITIISNMDAVIQDALNNALEMDVDEFLDHCSDGEDCIETSTVKENYDDCTLTGNFVEKYLDMTMSDVFRSEIASKVRNKLLKKYHKKKEKDNE